jgi:hypothetical protein
MCQFCANNYLVMLHNQVSKLLKSWLIESKESPVKMALSLAFFGHLAKRSSTGMPSWWAEYPNRLTHNTISGYAGNCGLILCQLGSAT